MSGTISIPGYNPNNRVPGVFAAVDASKANTGTINQRTLLLGPMLATGTATAGNAVLTLGPGDAQTAFGPGSILAHMVERYRRLDLTGELWCLPLADAIGSAAATATITYTGTATAAGVIPLYVNGVRIAVAVNLNDTAATVATNTASAINNTTSAAGNPLSVTAAAAGAVVTLTSRNLGGLGNMATLLLSYRGTAGGEGQPGATNVAGIGATLTAFAGGSSNPSIANALVNLPDQTFDFICNPWNDTTSIAAVTSFLADAAGRWNWSVQLFGGAFTAKGGTLATRTTWSTGLNDQHLTAIGANGSPSPDWAWAVDYCAASAVSLRADPTLPVGGLTAGVALNVLAPPLATRDSFAARQTLLFDGMSSYKVDNGGTVHVDRAITTHQLNTAGMPDNSYLNLNVPYQLMAYIRAVETLIGTNFNQAKLVDNGTRIAPGSGMVTPQTILNSVIAQYAALASDGLPGVPAGLVQNAAAFATAAQATNAGGGVVNLLLPVQLGNQLYVAAIDVQFTTP